MIVTTGGVMKSDQHPTRRSVIHTAFVSGAAIGIRSFAQVRHQFDGTAAGEERDLSGIRFCWCPAGHFLMGSPRNEPERRPGEDQVEVKLSRGFWTAKHETTQSQWNRIVGGLPGPLTAELPAGDDLPAGTSILWKRRSSAESSRIAVINHANFQVIGSFVFPPRHSGNTRVVREPRPRPHLAIGSAVTKRTSRGCRTTEANRDHP